MQIVQLDDPPRELTELPNVRHTEGTRYLLTEQTRADLRERADLSDEARRHLTDADARTVDGERLDSARNRLVLGIAHRFSDDLPSAVTREALLALLTDDDTCLEYIGRGVKNRELAPDDDVLSIDVTGGRRDYFFRVTDPSDPHLDGSPEFREILGHLTNWLNDPDAKLVLSVGGGGYRMFATIPILRTFDFLLEDRSRVSEVWGCSGGAVAAHAFADGFDPDVLEQLAYDLYHQRRPSMPDYSVPSVAKLWMDEFLDAQRDPTELKRSWLEALDEFQPKSDRDFEPRPFYAVATDIADSNLHALCDPAHYSSLCDDFMVRTDRARALAATSAVPFIFPVQRSETGDQVWVDGALIDENPLALPFVKWRREQRRRPESTPEKLKIFLIDLNARATESSILNRLSEIPVVGSLIRERLARQLDLLLDSRLKLTLQTLAEIPDVEIFRAKLSIGAFAVRDRSNILEALQSGRRLESWSISTIGEEEYRATD